MRPPLVRARERVTFALQSLERRALESAGQGIGQFGTELNALAVALSEILEWCEDCQATAEVIEVLFSADEETEH